MTKRLAVHSPTAKPFNDAERRLSAALAKRYNVTLVKTGAAHAPVDAVWVRNGVCVGCSEHKVRQITRDEIRTMGDTYLITEQKLFDGIELSNKVGAAFYVAALFVPDQTAYVWKVTDDHGVPQFTWAAALTTTQETCEGGTATRVNAYLPMAHATAVRVGSIQQYLQHRRA